MISQAIRCDSQLSNVGGKCWEPKQMKFCAFVVIPPTNDFTQE